MLGCARVGVADTQGRLHQCVGPPIYSFSVSSHRACAGVRCKCCHRIAGLMGARLFGFHYVGSLRIPSRSCLAARSSERCLGRFGGLFARFYVLVARRSDSGAFCTDSSDCRFCWRVVHCVARRCARTQAPKGQARVTRWLAYPTTAAVTVLGSAAIVGNGLLGAQKIYTDRVAGEKRVRSLYDAPVCAVEEYGDVSSAQDGIKVERCYHGPAFNGSEWQGMTRAGLGEHIRPNRSVAQESLKVKWVLTISSIG
jgi:hypothetical protein